MLVNAGRLSLMLVLQWNGVLAAWDLLRRQHEPALTAQLCEEPLLRVRMQEAVRTTRHIID